MCVVGQRHEVYPPLLSRAELVPLVPAQPHAEPSCVDFCRQVGECES